MQAVFRYSESRWYQLSEYNSCQGRLLHAVTGPPMLHLKVCFLVRSWATKQTAKRHAGICGSSAVDLVPALTELTITARSHCTFVHKGAPMTKPPRSESIWWKAIKKQSHNANVFIPAFPVNNTTRQCLLLLSILLFIYVIMPHRQ